MQIKASVAHAQGYTICSPFALACSLQTWFAALYVQKLLWLMLP